MPLWGLFGIWRSPAGAPPHRHGTGAFFAERFGQKEKGEQK